jgi:hypothetical protein
MILNTKLLPSYVWSVRIGSETKDTSWTTRKEARQRKVELNDQGIVDVRIYKTQVTYITTPDNHS